MLGEPKNHRVVSTLMYTFCLMAKCFVDIAKGDSLVLLDLLWPLILHYTIHNPGTRYM